ncbi:hypothetical protein RRG08_053911 [Elysia crispata]|uniref:Uncharacterized protein n=1 Tax=Elysia crispata TaxID=231223 RepID=A0AAE1DJC2_9GAST|nr:hypothetical protein RRG08_053911 [Elysia crispata]
MKNNSTRSERQNTPQSYPKKAEDKRQLCPPLETPVSYEENLRFLNLKCTKECKPWSGFRILGKSPWQCS